MGTRSEELMELFAEQLTSSGMSRDASRTFGCLMFAPGGRLTAAELSQQLGVGASTISSGAKSLRAGGLIRATRLPDRQIVYTVLPDVWAEATVTRFDRLRALESVLVDGAQDATDPSTAHRLRETADFFSFLRTRLAVMLDEWRADRARRDTPQ